MFDAAVYWPSEHSEQMVSFVLVVSSNCPAKHSEQDKLPFDAVLPAPQASHGVARLRAVDAVSSRQSLHATAPFISWYCPGMHPTQYGMPSSLW
jgi:hypothetical protein